MAQSQPRGQARVRRVFGIGLGDGNEREMDRAAEVLEEGGFIREHFSVKHGIDEPRPGFRGSLQRLRERVLLRTTAAARGFEEQLFDRPRSGRDHFLNGGFVTVRAGTPEAGRSGKSSAASRPISVRLSSP